MGSAFEYSGFGLLVWIAFTVQHGCLSIFDIYLLFLFIFTATT